MRRLALPALVALSACAPYGPDNTWYHARQSDLPEGYAAGTGYGLGDVPPDVVLRDQHGDEVALHQFYGQVVQLVLMAQWCPPCQEEAPAVEQAWVDLQDRGAQVIEVMLESSDDTLDYDDCAAWADAYGATHPVLADVGGAFRGMLIGGFPTNPILDRELRVVREDNFPFRASLIEEVLDAR